MSELPKGWAIAELGEVSQVEWGNTSITKKSYSEEGYIAFSAAGGDGFLPHYENEGDAVVLSAIGAGCGKCFQARGKWTAIKNTITIKPESGLLANYIFHYLNNPKVWEVSGSGQPFITLGNARPTKIPIPPIAEQTRITQKLEELLAQIGTLKARLDDIPALLKRFRQSTLTAAVSGRLTEEWRKENSHAVDLKTLTSARTNALGKHAKEKCTTPTEASLDIPPGWISANFDLLCEVKHGYAFESQNFGDSGPIVITPGNFTDEGTLDFQNKRTIRLNAPYEMRWKLENGDILIVMTDLSQKKLILGKVVELQCNDVVLHNQRIGKVIPFSDQVSAQFLRLALLAPLTKQVIDETATGTVVQHTSPSKILQIRTMVPALPEQTEIVRRVEQLFAFTDQLEAKIKTAQARVNHLTQSILAKAFRGELVPQDPNDEPASELLARIQAQRAAEPKAKRGRKASV